MKRIHTLEIYYGQTLRLLCSHRIPFAPVLVSAIENQEKVITYLKRNVSLKSEKIFLTNSPLFSVHIKRLKTTTAHVIDTRQIY